MFEITCEERDGQRRKVHYPLEKMNPGDSFIVRDRSLWSSAREKVKRYGERFGINFALKTTREGLIVTLLAWNREGR